MDKAREAAVDTLFSFDEETPSVSSIHAAIDAYIEARRAEGFVEVPVEPTEAMVNAVYEADLDIYWSYRGDGSPGNPDDVYRAMLSAAQPQQSPDRS